MKAIKLVLGVTPTCWRPPFGDVDDRIRAIANGLGLRTIIWRYDSFDWEAGLDGITVQDVDNNYQQIITAAQNGTLNTGGVIMLTHELNNFTMQTAVQYYNMLKSTFKALVPVGVALNKTQPYVETNYSLPTFESYTGGSVTNSSTGSSSPSSTGKGSSTESSSASPTSGGSSSGSSGSSSQSGSGASHVAGVSVAAVLAATLAFFALST